MVAVTVFPELTDAFVETFSAYVDEHPEFTVFEFALGHNAGQRDAVRDALTVKYPGRSFVVTDVPSPQRRVSPMACCRTCGEPLVATFEVRFKEFHAWAAAHGGSTSNHAGNSRPRNWKPGTANCVPCSTREFAARWRQRPMSEPTYFSVDVEASSTMLTRGLLLSVGIVPVAIDGDVGLGNVPEFHGFYARVQQFAIGEERRWSDKDCWNFWAEQETKSPMAWSEIFDTNLVRHSDRVVARMIAEYLEQFPGGQMEHIFVASPTSYDKPWIDKLFADARLPAPFSWRSIDLRSCQWALDPDDDITQSNREHESEVPHHALYDARAQALTLMDILEDRNRRRVHDEDS